MFYLKMHFRSLNLQMETKFKSIREAKGRLERVKKRLAALKVRLEGGAVREWSSIDQLPDDPTPQEYAQMVIDNDGHALLGFMPRWKSGEEMLIGWHGGSQKRQFYVKLLASRA